ncbi:putative synaptic vesicle 2-related protein-like isoform X4 [Apostichopus japonicus]|uniref:Putative synaptic vesicle 2-related protein-like isoform X4 n=1 Tax=Stichopus japonicus TaxID=307972 RepID=A0A2G8KFA6_STIJA|nr:putative synaptic vesicle 2-related protein-like isoform X4 [Apostichopus japonicus]
METSITVETSSSRQNQPYWENKQKRMKDRRPPETNFEEVERNDFEALDDQGSSSEELLLGGEDTYTVEEAIDKCGFGLFQLKISCITGVLFMADAFEIIILSILADQLHCDWSLSLPKKALITTVVFVGYLIGASTFGSWSDKYGRKNIVWISSFWIFVFGILSSFAPTLLWMYIARFCVGVGLGGAAQVWPLYAEFLPSRSRGRTLGLMQIFWVIGVLTVVAMAAVVVPLYGWRVLLFLAALPQLVFLILMNFVPESPMFDVVSGQRRNAERTLRIVAKVNKKSLPHGRLTVKFSTESRGTISDLFKTWRTSIASFLLFFIWFVTAFTYYGIVLLSTELFSTGNICEAQVEEHSDCADSCQKLDAAGYLQLIATSSSELVSIFVVLTTIDIIGRKRSLMIFFSLASVFIFLLNLCVDLRYITIFVFVIRGFSSSLFTVIYIYTTEVYPTHIRSIGLGMCSSMARFGPITTPFFAQVLLAYSPRMTVSCYGIFTLLAAIGVLFLPYETKGVKLKSAATIG